MGCFALPGENTGGQGFGGAGWAGVCWKLKQSDMSSACASRWFNAGNPNRDSQNFSRLTCECNVFETYPLFAYGPNTKHGTRDPYRNWVPLYEGCGVASLQVSTFGGFTWSYHPPQSSHVMKIAILPQSPPFTIAFTWSTVHCIPVVTFPIGPFPGFGGCSSN